MRVSDAGVIDRVIQGTEPRQSGKTLRARDGSPNDYVYQVQGGAGTGDWYGEYGSKEVGPFRSRNEAIAAVKKLMVKKPRDARDATITYRGYQIVERSDGRGVEIWQNGQKIPGQHWLAAAGAKKSIDRFLDYGEWGWTRDAAVDRCRSKIVDGGELIDHVVPVRDASPRQEAAKVVIQYDEGKISHAEAVSRIRKLGYSLDEARAFLQYNTGG